MSDIWNFVFAALAPFSSRHYELLLEFISHLACLKRHMWRRGELPANHGKVVFAGLWRQRQNFKAARDKETCLLQTIELGVGVLALCD